MTAVQTANPLEAFQWSPQPEAEALITGLAVPFLSKDPLLGELQHRLRDDAGVRILDLVDSIHTSEEVDVLHRLLDAGFDLQRDDFGVYLRQKHGIFPVVRFHKISSPAIWLKVESVTDFLAVWQSGAEIEGPPLGPMRRARISRTDAGEVWIIERHGYHGFHVPDFAAHDAVAVLNHAEAFRRRRRVFANENEGFDQAHRLIDAAIADLGLDRACDLFFAAEREYWQRRNRAGQVQKARQDKLGIGWANHDHHTYRSSREHFARMIGVFEKLGFHCRERFYAGHQAGWGAQVLEQPNAGIVIFADVDLSPDELMGDFSHDGLAPRDALGTVGLWCELHGEAFLEAGMHHLECQFDFEALKRQLEEQENVKVMKPFTDFPYLRQAFTEGEIWPVRPERIDRLLKAGRIAFEQAKQFREHGALGSHLENLERNQGFKGFNQTGVSEIIARTDPRAQAAQR